MEGQRAGAGAPQARPPSHCPQCGGSWEVQWLSRAKGQEAWGHSKVSHRCLVQEAVVEVEEGLLGLLGAQGAQHVRVQVAQLRRQRVTSPATNPNHSPWKASGLRSSGKCSLVSTIPTPKCLPPWGHHRHLPFFYSVKWFRVVLFAPCYRSHH